MKKIGVIGTKNGWSSERLTRTAAEIAGHSLLINMNEVRLELPGGKVWYRNVDLNDFDALIIKKIGARYSPDLLDRLEILRFMHARGMKIFSSPLSIIRVLDRLSCTITMQLADIPMPPTCITEDVVEALDILDEYREAVFKPLYTSKARGMMVLKAGKDARKAIEEFACDNRIMYIQKKINLNGRDLGVTFLGGEYLTTYSRHNEGNSWTTTTEFGGKYEPYDPPKEIIELAHKAQSLFNLDFTCVDVAELKDGPIVFEVSAFGGFRGILDAQGIDAARLYTDYVLKKINE